MSILNNKKNNKGFTLVESLVSLVTVSLVTMIFLTLTMLAKDTYVSVEMGSEAQVLASILTSTIQDELRFAVGTEYDTNNGTTVKLYESDTSSCNAYPNFTYYSKSLNLGADCKIVNYNGQIYVVPLYTTNKSNIAAAKKQTVTGTSTYVFDIRAYADAYYVPEKKAYYVYLAIVDKNYDETTVNNAIASHTLGSLSGTLYSTSFAVESLNKDTLY